MVFRNHWFNLVYKAAKSTRKIRTLLTPIGATIFCLFTASFVLAAISIDRLLDLPRLLPEMIRLTVSIPVIALGAVITVWSGFHFLKAKGTPVPFNPPPRVVKTGPYMYVRNPMLAGVFVFLYGLGFYINSISLVVFFVPIFVLVNVWELKQIEEPELIKRLGDEYIKYRRETPIFIPSRKPKSNSEV